MSGILFTLLFSSFIFNILQAARLKEYKNEIIKLNQRLKKVKHKQVASSKVIKQVKSQADKDIEQIAKKLNVPISRATEIYNNRNRTSKGNNKRSLN